MRYIVKPEDPEQKTLFDPESCGWWHTGMAPEAYRRLEGGMEGVFRSSILELMPVERVGQAFDEMIGRPSKELPAACGLPLLAEFRNWTVDQTADAWCFDASVQYALNLLRDRQNMSPRTVVNYRALSREEGLAQAAEDIAELISRFEEIESVAKRGSYQAMARVFSEHFEVTAEKIEVLPKAEDENG